eukprot:g1321.t1
MSSESGVDANTVTSSKDVSTQEVKTSTSNVEKKHSSFSSPSLWYNYKKKKNEPQVAYDIALTDPISVRIIKSMSFMYGYAMFIILFITAVLVVFAAIPITDWNSKVEVAGIMKTLPMINKTFYYTFTIGMLVITAALWITTNIAQYPYSPNEFHGYIFFRCSLATTLIVGSACLLMIILLNAAGVDLLFYFLDIPLCYGFMATLIVVDSVSRGTLWLVDPQKLTFLQQQSHIQKNVELVVNDDIQAVKERYCSSHSKRSDKNLKEQIDDAENKLQKSANVYGHGDLKALEAEDSDDEDDDEATTIANSMMRAQVDTEEMAKLTGAEDNEAKSVGHCFREVGYLVVLIFFLAFYPILVIPIYQSDSTSEPVRVLICCVVHPILQELILSYLRISRYDTKADFLHSSDLIASQNLVFMLELLLVLYRRCFIVSMRTQSAVITAIVLTGIEEAGLRLTLKERDDWLRQISEGTKNKVAEAALSAKKKKRLARKEKLKRAMEDKLLGISIVHSTINEIIACIITRVIFLVLMPHRYIFNVGDINQSTTMLITNMIIELISETLVDSLCLYAEAKRGIFVDEYMNLIQRPMQFAATCMSSTFPVVVTIWTFTSVPTALFCKSANPCSCTGDRYALYIPLCNTTGINGTSTSNETITAMEKSVQKEKNAFTDPFSSMSESDLFMIGVGFFGFLCILSFLAMIILSIRNRKFVEEQDKLDKKLQKMSNLLKTAQNIVDDVMGQDESEDLKDARQIAFADIELGEVIGEGSFGNVYKAKYHGETVAVKMMTPVAHRMKQKITRFKEEIELMAPLRHPNLIVMFGACWKDGAECLCLVLEYAGRGDYRRLLKDSRMKWQFPHKGIMAGTAKCMRYLHAQFPPILHRDLKPENIMVSACFEAKLADFGLARKSLHPTDEVVMSLVGSKGYCAPEVLRHEPYGTKADVFSFAIILYEAVSCRSAKTFLKRLQEQSLSTAYTVPDINNEVRGNRPMRKLIEACWAEESKKRPSFEEIVEILEKKDKDE